MKAFSFSAADDAFSLKRAPLRSDYSALALTLTSIVINNNPISGSPHRVSMSSVREQRGVVTIAPMCLKHRQPSLLFGVENDEERSCEVILYPSILLILELAVSLQANP